MFIPDFSKTIAQIAPHFFYVNIEGITLLGINSWKSPELLERAGAQLEGAVITDSFFESSPSAFVQEFRSNYKNTYDMEPTFYCPDQKRKIPTD